MKTNRKNSATFSPMKMKRRYEQRKIDLLQKFYNEVEEIQHKVKRMKTKDAEAKSTTSEEEEMESLLGELENKDNQQ